MDYPTVYLKYSDLESYDFKKENEAINYQIEYKNVKFDILVRYKGKSDQAIIFGTGAVRRNEKTLPVYSRITWAEKFSQTTIYYSDPTLLLDDKITLAWCYGTNEHWYLESIGFLLTKILNQLGIPVKNTLMTGSSGGENCAIQLAILLHSKATVINPQFDILQYKDSTNSAIETFKRVVLKEGEEFIKERVSIIQLIQKRNYVPFIHIIQNTCAKSDIEQQLTPFIQDLNRLKINVQSDKLRVTFYYNEEGHGGMPSKADTIRMIGEDLKIMTDDSEIEMEVNTMNINYDGVKNLIPQIYYQEKMVVSAADDILRGKLHTIPSITPYECDIHNINFSVMHSDRARSFQLYLQCLNPVMLLARAYQLNNNIDYLKTAFDIVKQWYAFQNDENNRNNNKFIYVDHAVGRRIENLIFFGKIYKQALGEDEEVFDLLCKIYVSHGVWLSKPENYTPAHNHGIMEDEALLHLGYILDKPDWRELAKSRLQQQENAAFNEEFVHTENSAGYANMVATLFIKIGRFLVSNGDADGQRFINDMAKTEGFQNWVTMPNGLLAQIGDTSGKPDQLYASAKLIERKEQSDHKVFPKSGYYFYRSNRTNSHELGTWKMVKSGYTNLTHKHADDISFMLYSKGFEIFTDSGMYGYTTDAYREYFLSAKAHNSIVVDDSSYNVSLENAEKCGLSNFETHSNFDIVTLYNNQYQDVNIVRHFYSNNDLTILHDIISSDNKHQYSQLFHLAENISIESRSDNEIVLKIAETSYKVILKQLLPIDSLDVLKGDINIPDYGLISRSSSHCSTTSTIKCNLNSTNTEFITLICIIDSEGNVQLNGRKIPYNQIRFGNGKFYCNEEVMLFMNTETYDTLKVTEDVLDSVVRSVSYEFYGNQVICTLNLNEKSELNCEFAYYLVKDNEVIEKVMYSKDLTYTFEVKEHGEYKFKYYVKSGTIKKSYIAPKITL